MSIQEIRDYMKSCQPEMVDLIRTLVEIESPTSHRDGVNRVGRAVVRAVADMARVTVHADRRFGDHLRLEFDVPTAGKGQVLGIGHMDTVWKVGTLQRMPWRVGDGRLWGPGVFDMKAGIVYLLFAARALRELGLRARRRYVVQLNADEEVGSPSSTPFTQAEAARSSAVLVAEPSAGLEGSVKTARAGGATFRLGVRGVAAHAGLDFGSGVSAIVELAGLVRRIAGWSDPPAGLTVNPGVIRGGTASNVVAERAEARVDVRFRRREDGVDIERRFRALEPADPRCTLTLKGGIRKMPMERTPGVVGLYHEARNLSSEMGIALGEASVGGGSDGNTTAAMGIPTLDGLGAVGEGAHALHESILIDRIADRAALITALVQRL